MAEIKCSIIYLVNLAIWNITEKDQQVSKASAQGHWDH
jgi:hypothetical protein